ncbi:MAG: hypothetical protein K0R90_1649 [Oscillospiraceae bacterium]|nr:hypothetical protein [Oscillospiraceae bacterium]
MKRNSLFKVCLSTFANIGINILITIILVLVVFSLGDNLIGHIIAQVLVAVIFSTLIYGPSWGDGDRDRNLAHFGKDSGDRYRGLKIGLISMLPFVILNILLILSKLQIIGDIMAVYRLLNAHIWPLIQITAPKIFEAKDVSWIIIFVWILSMLALPLITTIGYRLGFKGVVLSDKIVYRNKK